MVRLPGPFFYPRYFRDAPFGIPIKPDHLRNAPRGRKGRGPSRLGSITVRLTRARCGELAASALRTVTVAVYRPGSRPAARTRTETTPLPEPEPGVTESQAASVSADYTQGRPPVVVTASGLANSRPSPLEARKETTASDRLSRTASAAPPAGLE